MSFWAFCQRNTVALTPPIDLVVQSIQKRVIFWRAYEGAIILVY